MLSFKKGPSAVPVNWTYQSLRLNRLNQGGLLPLITRSKLSNRQDLTSDGWKVPHSPVVP